MINPFPTNQQLKNENMDTTTWLNNLQYYFPAIGIALLIGVLIGILTSAHNKRIEYKKIKKMLERKDSFETIIEYIDENSSQ